MASGQDEDVARRLWGNSRCITFDGSKLLQKDDLGSRSQLWRLVPALQQTMLPITHDNRLKRDGYSRRSGVIVRRQGESVSRTTRYKTLYVVSILILGAGVAAILFSTGVRPLAVVLAVAILMVPGRIQGHFWRDFFRGRRLLGQGKANDAIPSFASFLDQLAARPWLKKLIWLSWGIYTRDIEVMTRTNLGVAHMYLGEIETAEGHLQSAMELDPECPLPWHNQGVIHEVRGDEASAGEAFEKARSLGYTGDVSDQFVRTIGEALARLEGH